ncbi:hypothetical protein ACP4OV_021143 [Aristida adscensionis]
MASAEGGDGVRVRVVSRRLVKASDSTAVPHVLAVSNLDLLPQAMPVSMLCIYPRPPAGDFDAVVAAFEAGLPPFLNHFFPFAGRVAANPCSGLPEVHCTNQSAELVVGDAALAILDYGAIAASLRRIQLPYGADVALSVQLVSFACGGFTVAWGTSHVLVDGSALSLLVTAWSELARSGTLAVGSGRTTTSRRSAPRAAVLRRLARRGVHAAGRRAPGQRAHGRAELRRAPVLRRGIRPRRAARRGGERAATRVQAVSAYLWKALAGVVGAADARCRMVWWVDGRQRLRAPERRAAILNYVGNVKNRLRRRRGGRG